jgi:hypothetical protein
MEITIDIRVKTEERYGDNSNEVTKHLALVHPELDIDYKTTNSEEISAGTLVSYLSGSTEEALVSAILEYLKKTQYPDDSAGKGKEQT